MPDEPNVILMGGSIRAILRDHAGAEPYGYPGPGFQQKSPLGKDDDWKPPWPHSLSAAQTLFGADVYESGIHAGYRLTKARTEADRFDRGVIRYVHRGCAAEGGVPPPGKLSLKSFLEMENPWRDDRFDVITFRGHDEDGFQYEMRYEHGKGWRDVSGNNSAAEPVEFDSPAELNVSALLFAYTIQGGTSVLVQTSQIDSRIRFATSLGVLR
ncbi:MAG: hypothetical protein PHF20_03860 [Halothiobacillaceae bacterium]|nr:hypothetical protein [Halothiobacillaceae bacterium]